MPATAEVGIVQRQLSGLTIDVQLAAGAVVGGLHGTPIGRFTETVIFANKCFNICNVGLMWRVIWAVLSIVRPLRPINFHKLKYNNI